PFSVAPLLSYVKPKTEGEIIMVLDSSGFEQQLKDKTKDVNNALSQKIQADQEYQIQKLDNENDINQKKNALELAQIDLDKYQKGDYQQAKQDVEGRIETAKSDLESWTERAAWSRRMLQKGLMSKVQADADQDRRQGAKIAFDKVKKEEEE